MRHYNLFLADFYYFLAKIQGCFVCFLVKIQGCLERSTKLLISQYVSSPNERVTK